MAVGVVESLDGRAGHQERLEHAIFHDRHRARGDAFIVVGIRAVQVDVAGFLAGRIEDHREKIRQHFSAYALGEGLSFRFVFLAMAFHAVSEDLMKEDTRGAAREDRRTGEGLGFRRHQQRFQILGDTLDGGGDDFVARADSPDRRLRRSRRWPGPCHPSPWPARSRRRARIRARAAAGCLRC